MKKYNKPTVEVLNIELIDVVAASSSFGAFNDNDTLIDFGEI